MTNPELLQAAWIADPDAATEAQLRAWDWHAELERQDRGMTWLARRTGKSVSAVYRYSYKTLTPPAEWLREVARLLGGKVVAA